MNSRVENLCKRAKKADKDATCELLEIYYADIYAYLRRLCGNRQDAEDLTQQTFLKVWSSLDNFAGRSKFSTWLYRIAHNTCLDTLRKKALNAESRTDQWWRECIDQNPGPPANLAVSQFAQRLYQTVARINEDKRHVVHLHYYQGLSISETAEVLGIATSTVKYRLREVLKILRVKLGDEKTGFQQEQVTPRTKGE
ncbi:MAG: RNA polymerase sigma factor [Planctomycetota bacterium]|jgi:RNA polymerase sigma-70 factor (ECF subfamily)